MRHVLKKTQGGDYYSRRNGFSFHCDQKKPDTGSLFKSDYHKDIVMKIKSIITFVVTAFLLSGCKSGLVSPSTKETKRSYVIYNVTVDSISPSQMSDAIKSALQENTSKVRIVEDLPPYPLPAKAPRFELKSPFGKKSALAALANIKIPTCDGALVYAQAANTSFSAYGEKTQVFVCLWQYESGYHVDVYSHFEIESGGLNNLGVDFMRSVMGDSSKFVPRTINSIKTKLDELGANVDMVTAYPNQLAQALSIEDK